MSENAGGFMGGLSAGLQQGVNMGYLRMQAQAMQQNQQRQAMMAEVEARRAEEQHRAQMEKENLATVASYMGIVKNTNAKDRPYIWAQLAPKINEKVGLNLDPAHYTPVTNTVLEQASKLMEEISANPENKVIFQKNMAQIGSLVALADEDQQKALSAARPFLDVNDPNKVKKPGAGAANRDAAILAAAYDDAFREEKASNISVNYGIEDLENMPEVRKRLEDRATQLFLQRTGRASPAGAGGTPPPAQDKIGDYLKSIGAKDNKANRDWAKGKIGG